MSLADYLDKGASLGRDAPCLVAADRTMSYGDVQELSWSVARALAGSGVRAGDKVAILSANDAVAFACVFGIARRGAVWCPINPRGEADENRQLLDMFDCTCLMFQAKFAPLVAQIATRLPALRMLVCLDSELDAAPSLQRWLVERETRIIDAVPPGDVAMILGTGGTTGLPKGVELTNRNIETMAALTLMGYPFRGRPVHLALAPLNHATGMLCFPTMALGGRVVLMAQPDLGEFLGLIERHRVTHTYLPPTLIYMLLRHPDLAITDLGSLQCLWYGAAPMSPSRLAEAITVIGPVLGQLFGQSEAPMVISMLSPAEHLNADGTIAQHRLSSAGRPAPLVTVGIMDASGALLENGQRGEIVVRSSLVMAGYYKNPAATAESSRHGWHHTGDIGYLDDDGYLFVVDRAKDTITTGGFNVYSTEVEQAMMQHPAVLDCAVIGLPDEKWGERVAAVVQLRAGDSADAAELAAFVRSKVGGVKAPKQVEIWPDLPRSKVGKVLKAEVRGTLLR